MKKQELGLTKEERNRAVSVIWKKHDELEDKDFWESLYEALEQALLDKLFKRDDIVLRVKKYGQSDAFYTYQYISFADLEKDEEDKR